MKFKFKSSEVMILLAVSVMSLLANLPDSVLGLVDRRWLLGTLAALVVIALFRYLQVFLLIVITILAIGANLPAELAAELGISRLALIISLGVLITITLLNRLTRMLPTESSFGETYEWRQSIMAAIVEEDEASLLRLLALNTEVNFTHDGITPLHLAAEHGSLDIMRILISNGADMFKKNSKGKTPMEVARVNAKTMKSSGTTHDDYQEQFRKQLRIFRQAENQRADAELWKNQRSQ